MPCLLAALLAAAVPAAPRPDFDGTFVAANGDRAELQRQGDGVTGRFLATGRTGHVTGLVTGERLKGQIVVAGGAGALRLAATPDGFDALFGTSKEPVRFRREEARPPKAAAEPGKGARKPPPKPPKAPTPTAARPAARPPPSAP